MSDPSPPAILGIVVVGDVLRPGLDDAIGGVDNQIGWLFTALRRQLQAATGLGVELLTADDPEIAPILLAMPRDGARAAWALHFERAPEALASVLERRLKGRVCIGYELPRYLVTLMAALGVPAIDLRVHPIRFMDDLMFAAHASDVRMQAALRTLAISRGEIEAIVGLRDAMLQMTLPVDVGPDTLLVLGQQPCDSSQIVGGAFFDPMQARARIEALCHRHRHVLIKRHPKGHDNALLDLVQRLRPDAVITRENVYRLIASPRIACVLSVNSSASEEARWFGRDVETLLPAPIRIGWREDADEAVHVAVGDLFLTADFWRRVLAPLMAVTALDGVVLAAKPNRLRIAIGEFWGFQEIDTDMIPARPPTSIPPVPSPSPSSTAPIRRLLALPSIVKGLQMMASAVLSWVASIMLEP